MQDRPSKKKKRNFFTPTIEERNNIRISKLQKKIIKKENNLRRLEALEKQVKGEKQGLSAKVADLKSKKDVMEIESSKERKNNQEVQQQY